MAMAPARWRKIPRGALPLHTIANFTAVDSGLWDEPPILVSVLGLDRLDNWRDLPREAALARRERWLDAIQASLDRDYPGFSGLVTTRMLLNAYSMASYLNTPEGAVYGFAALPAEDADLDGISAHAADADRRTLSRLGLRRRTWLQRRDVIGRRGRAARRKAARRRDLMMRKARIEGAATRCAARC